MSDETCSFQSDRAFAGINQRYNTPTDAPTGYLCRRVRIPDNLDFIAAVNELLSRLCFPEVWTERSGGLTTDDAVRLANLMYDDYAESEGYCMIGAVIPFAGSSLPPNMLWCDGTTYLKADYPELAAALHDNFIVDDDHFRVPNMNGRFPLGRNFAGDDHTGDTGGEAAHTLTTDELPAHTHGNDAHTHDYEDAGHTHVQNAHNHGVTDPGHNHTQNSHNHTQNAHGHTGDAHSHFLSDPGHTHSIAHTHTANTRDNSTPGTSGVLMKGSATGSSTTFTVGGISTATSGSATTGATIDNSTVSVQNATATNNATTATNNSNTTGLTVNNATPTNQNAVTGITIDETGITIHNTGEGVAHNNLPPYTEFPYVIITR